MSLPHHAPVPPYLTRLTRLRRPAPLPACPPYSVWDVRTGQVARTLELNGGAVTSIEVTRCGRYLVTADGGQVDFRDAATFDLLKSHAVEGYQVESASYAPEKGRCGGCVLKGSGLQAACAA